MLRRGPGARHPAGRPPRPASAGGSPPRPRHPALPPGLHRPHAGVLVGERLLAAGIRRDHPGAAADAGRRGGQRVSLGNLE